MCACTVRTLMYESNDHFQLQLSCSGWASENSYCTPSKEWASEAKSLPVILLKIPVERTIVNVWVYTHTWDSSCACVTRKDWIMALSHSKHLMCTTCTCMVVVHLHYPDWPRKACGFLGNSHGITFVHHSPQAFISTPPSLCCYDSASVVVMFLQLPV